MIKPVSYSAILDDPNWPALMSEYDAECAIPELGAPSPQRDLYELLEKSGGFQAFGVYDYPKIPTVQDPACANKTRLIGFATVLIYALPHYGVKIATTESIFMQVGNPSPWGGLKLLAHVKSYAKENGCTDFLPSAPVGSRFDRLLKALSPGHTQTPYRHTNNVYLCVL